jgi:hypothetical protein
MKAFIRILLIIFLSSASLHAQSIIGKWQLVKQSNCLEDDIDAADSGSGVEEVLNDMQGMSGATPQVLQFKDKNMAEESTRMISRRKSYNSKSLMYRFSPEALHFLDKKSHTLLESFTVEKFSADSLIISNASRACETKVFIRIK